MEGSVRFFEKPITDEEIDKASESEMADRITAESDKEIDGDAELELAGRLSIEKERSMEKYQVEIKGELVDLFERTYFDIMNKIDRLAGVGGDIKKIKEEDEKFNKKFNFDIGKLKEYVDGIIPEIMGRINKLSKDGKINNIVGNNSLRDVLQNSLFEGLGTVLLFRKNMKEGKFLDKLDDPNSKRREMLVNADNLLRSEDMKYYFGELCVDENKLKQEVESEGGYLSNFSDYFYDVEKMRGVFSKDYPTGSHKLPYFKFFSEVEKWKNDKDSLINDDNFEEELDKLNEIDDRSKRIIIDKNRIRRDFLNK